VPLIALTGNGSEDGDYTAAGFDGHITKPIDADKLEECLKQFLPPELIQ
jgi:CheY-like chemotaxis protein